MRENAPALTRTNQAHVAVGIRRGINACSACGRESAGAAPFPFFKKVSLIRPTSPFFGQAMNHPRLLGPAPSRAHGAQGTALTKQEALHV